MGCKRCGSKREINRYNDPVPNNVDMVSLDYVGGGSLKTFYNPKTKLVRQAGGPIPVIQVPVGEVEAWLDMRRNNRYQFRVSQNQGSQEPPTIEEEKPVVEQVEELEAIVPEEEETEIVADADSVEQEALEEVSEGEEPQSEPTQTPAKRGGRKKKESSGENDEN